ncbi:class I SAM-dependent methyltransferase [Pseudomonas sp. MWU13-2105]|uniref:class I SAM-dependent methyltransferase n=1 Tax=Pseudomonas sp. MWU13-2105 TaxID=2935074 RepID=UPI0020106C3B|nr:class I SAM-dependent methyltransferase [Pseudomonas sp. MWU13-2105]
MHNRKQLEARLQAVGIDCGCDKVVPHHYHRFYATHFLDYVDHPFKLLEIGVGGEGREPGGASLQLWAEVFPLAEIYGLDIYDKSVLDRDRVKTFIVDQGDALALNEFVEKHGPFDIVIDDGSHKRSDQLTSLFTLVSSVVPGGYYVLEDYFTSYWPVYDGSTLAKDFLDTPVRWLKQSIDIINRNNLLSEPVKALLPDWGVEELHVYPGVAFLRKGMQAVRSEIPGGDFFENQLELDELRYGKYQAQFLEYARDPMTHLAQLNKLKRTLEDKVARIKSPGRSKR